MLTHLLDTDICIHALKSRDLNLSRRLVALQGHCAISDISVYELCSGAQRYDEPDKRLDIVENLFARLTVLPFTTEAARIGGKLRYQLETKGQVIGGFDMLIAATALMHGLTLLTNNIREFKRVPGLMVETMPKA